MTIAAFYPAEAKVFRSMLADIRRLVDPEVRLPAWPFRAPKGVVDICQYSNAI